MKLPSQGMSHDEVMGALSDIKARDIDWKSGRTWAYVYDAGDGARKVCEEASSMFLWQNALDPTVFPSMLTLENNLVGIMAEHLNAPESAVGCYTSGGTESIFLAIKAAREGFRAVHGDDAVPEIVLPETAHAAHQKAAYYMGMKVVLVPVDKETYKVDVAAVEAAITDNTCLLVGSAPSYAHGVIDPIEALGAVAKARGIRLHVDACIGGWLLPYFKQLGAPVPAFDFSVEGVTSMSCDYHKYGFAPKGASIILHRDADLRRGHIYACADWTGYTLVNNAVQSSKSGGPLAAAWAALHFMGEEGYLELAGHMRKATRDIIDGVNAIDGLSVLGDPEMNLVAIAGEGVDIFHVCDEMNLRGWFVQPQLGIRGHAPNIHLSINPKGLPHVPTLLKDFETAVEAARGLETSPMVAQITAAFSAVDPATIDSNMLQQMLGMAGVEGTNLPERMAEINAVLDSLPPVFREKMMIAFVDMMYRP